MVVVALLALVGTAVAAYALGRSSTNVNVDWGSLILALVAVGGLVLAGYQARLNSQERLAIHRQVLYEQQVLACIEVMTALTKLEDVVLRAVWNSFPAQPTPWIWTQEASERAWRAMTDSLIVFKVALEGRAGILPDAVATLLFTIADDIRDVFTVDDRCAQARLDKCIMGRGAVMERIRFFLGVEPLSRQMLQRIGPEEMLAAAMERAIRHRGPDSGGDIT